MDSAVPMQQLTDLEQGEVVAPKKSVQGFPKEYYILYAFCLFVLATGTWSMFLPFAKSSFVGTMCGVGGLVIGVFLMLNADLLVTYLRLMREMERFKANNKQFAGSLVEQKKKISKLKKSKKALDCLERNVGNKLEGLGDEMKEIEYNARDNVRRNVVNVLLVSRPRQQEISAGNDLEDAIRMFTLIYIRAFPLIVHRFVEMRKGLEASTRWQETQKLGVDRFKFIVVLTLFDDLGTIKETVRKSAEDASNKAEHHQETRKSTSAPAVKGGSGDDDDADWADAAAFAQGKEGTSKEQDALMEMEDSWADDIAFAEGR